MLEAHGLTLGLAILVQVLEGPILVGVGEGVRVNPLLSQSFRDRCVC